jgi:hypothetical protein
VGLSGTYDTPGASESFWCWVEPGGSRCGDFVRARQAQQRAEVEHQAAIAAAAQRVQSAQVSAIVQNLALVGVPVLLVVGGVGGFLWWRRQQKQQVLSPSEVEQVLTAYGE